MVRSEWSELGWYLVRPEEWLGEVDCRRFRDCPARFAADKCLHVAKRVSQTRFASVCKVVFWLAVSMAVACGLGQLQ